MRDDLFTCEKLGLSKSKMASVEEIRTRISLREHDVINVSLTSVSTLKIGYNILYTVSDKIRFFFRRIAQISLETTLVMMTRGVKKNLKK